MWLPYLNLSLANEYVGDVTIPTQVIKYKQIFIQADQPITLQYSNQIKLSYIKLTYGYNIHTPHFNSTCIQSQHMDFHRHMSRVLGLCWVNQGERWFFGLLILVEMEALYGAI